MHRAVPEDWRAWREVRLRGLRSDPDAFGSAWQREQDFTEQQWRERLATSYAVLARVGAAVQAEPVATGGLVIPTPGVSQVVAMWTAPEHRGRGVGRAVLEHLVGAVPRGDRLVLWVADQNPAERLYRDLGFAPTGAREPIRPGATLMKSEMERPPRPAGPPPSAAGA
ncbi:GNAT family N-acetyltransferase [Nocardioides sp. HDW12B]|uniref:GNAT family N-acetyltransferase n=1 Tax=Nocardioides sp. HDW12B TaxID=2714939 RepID=UPI00140C77F7|nr:GNAT family N-acetyltransferase [Nocardioides sp. HDW12B]QIK65842.1 GNAT family N-acetyltransferase [Nocardioides sp. HDW12B]